MTVVYFACRSQVTGPIVGTDHPSRHPSPRQEPAERLTGLNRGQRDDYGRVLSRVIETSVAPGRDGGHTFQVCVVDGVDWAIIFSAHRGSLRNGRSGSTRSSYPYGIPSPKAVAAAESS